jgi:predicted oxidoreductase
MAKADIGKLNTGGPSTNYVDLLLLHFPPLEGCGSAQCPKIQQQWTALEQLYKANITRAIGVSNFCQQCIECVLVRCAFFDQNIALRMSLDHTPARLKLLHAFDKWHSSQVVTLLPADTVHDV